MELTKVRLMLHNCNTRAQGAKVGGHGFEVSLGCLGVPCLKQTKKLVSSKIIFNCT